MSQQDQALPPIIKLRVNRAGEWFHEGVKISHENTWKAFSRNLRIEEGRLIVRIKREWAEVEAEDAPLIVTAIRFDSNTLKIFLHDERNVMFEPETLFINSQNVPYCKIDGVPARFSTAAYYQLVEFIHPHPNDENQFVLALPNGRTHAISME